MHRLDEMVRLHRMKNGAHEIARMFKIGPSVERMYRLAFKAEGLLEGPVLRTNVSDYHGGAHGAATVW